MCDKTKKTASVWQSKSFNALQKDRYLVVNSHRGTYGSIVYVCTNTAPQFGDNLDIANSPQCKAIGGPSLTYAQYKDGDNSGTVIAAGTTQVFIVMVNPVDSGSDTAGFLIDRITLNRDTGATSGPMSC